MPNPPYNTGEFFDLIVARGEEQLERYDHLTMNPEAETRWLTM